jgi:hypothetical protein
MSSRLAIATYSIGKLELIGPPSALLYRPAPGAGTARLDFFVADRVERRLSQHRNRRKSEGPSHAPEGDNEREAKVAL